MLATEYLRLTFGAFVDKAAVGMTALFRRESMAPGASQSLRQCPESLRVVHVDDMRDLMAQGAHRLFPAVLLIGGPGKHDQIARGGRAAGRRNAPVIPAVLFAGREAYLVKNQSAVEESRVEAMKLVPQPGENIGPPLSVVTFHAFYYSVAASTLPNRIMWVKSGRGLPAR